MNPDTIQTFLQPEPGLYLISRASGWTSYYGDKIPHSDAFQALFPFYTKNENRPTPESRLHIAWFLRIPDLLEWIKRENENVIVSFDNDFPHLKIYDDYIE